MSTVRRVLSIQYNLVLTFSNNTDVNAWKSENTRNRETSKYIQNNEGNYGNHITDKMSCWNKIVRKRA